MKFLRFILPGLIPAVIGGLIAISPAIYKNATTPGKKLEFRVTDGPVLQSPEGFRKILITEVQNSGGQPLSEVSLTFEFPTGKIEQYRVDSKSGVNLSHHDDNKIIRISAARLLPSDTFIVSAMVLSPSPNDAPEILLRSDDVLGEEAKTVQKPSQEPPVAIIAFLVAVSVFGSTSIINRVVPRIVKSRYSHNKGDSLFYIMARLKLIRSFSDLKVDWDDLSFLRTADILLAHGTSTIGEHHLAAICALECLLLIKNIADTSKVAVIHNLSILQGATFSQEGVDKLLSNSINTNEGILFRKGIDTHISAFFSSKGD